MLSDVFIDRYEGTTIWLAWTPSERKLLTQCSQILSEDLYPISLHNGEDLNERAWIKASKLLCRELGTSALSATQYPANNGVWYQYSVRQQALNFLLAAPVPGEAADQFMKSRLSFIELMLRIKFEGLSVEHPNKLLEGLGYDKIRADSRARLDDASIELNARMARAGVPLNYHNGFIQVSDDPLIAEIVERPFWSLVDQPRWSNVDLEMKEAIDRRDTGLSDAAFHAAKSLESAIKIIGAERGWTTGKEKGAADHTSNLWSAGGGRMLEEWQVTSLKFIFAKLRNPFGHGAGAGAPVALSKPEIDWAISMAMSWISLLIREHEKHAQEQ